VTPWEFHDADKTKMIGLPCGEEIMTIIMLSRFHRIPVRNGRTDGRTDRQTSDIIPISISLVSMLTRDKNEVDACHVLSVVCHRTDQIIPEVCQKSYKSTEKF